MRLGLSERWVRKLLARVQKEGDHGVVHRLRGRASNRKVGEKEQQRAVKLLGRYLEDFGRPVEFYTDKGSLFSVNQSQRHEAAEGWEEGRTQIGRALKELWIGWVAAHSPQAKGRIERFFGTAQDRLVKGLRIAQVSTLEAANGYHEQEYLPL